MGIHGILDLEQQGLREVCRVGQTCFVLLTKKYGEGQRIEWEMAAIVVTARKP